MAADATFTSLYARSITCAAFTPPANSIGKAAVQDAAGIEATKVQRRVSSRVSQKNGTANVAQREVLRFVHGATGSLVKFYARNTTAPVTTSTTVDLYKNGVSVLTAPLVLTSVEGTILQSTTSFSATSLVAGDVLEAVVTVSGATPGQGIAVQLESDEDPA